MQTRLFNLFIKSLKELNFDYIEKKILSRREDLITDERFLNLKNQHPFFGITQAFFETVNNYPEHEDKLKDIYISYIEKSKVSLSTPYYFNRHITNTLDIFGYVNYILSNKTNTKNQHILHTINNCLIKSGLNYNYEFSAPQPFIFSMMDRGDRSEKRNTSFNNSDYLKDFYFSNFDFSDKNKNSKLIAKIIGQFMYSYFDNSPFSYSILKHFLTSDQINYDKDIIRDKIKEELNKKRHISSIKPGVAEILSDFDLDYVLKDNEKVYLYPYFYPDREPSKDDYIQYKDKKGGYFAHEPRYFEGINQFLLQTLNIHTSMSYPEKYKKDIKIHSYENFYDLYDSGETKLITIDKRVLNKKFTFIDKHNLAVDHLSLIESLNSKIEEIKSINNLYSEDTFHDNFKAFINYHINHIDYDKKEQPLLGTIHLINSLQKHKLLIEFINEKAKELSFNNEHYYKHISFSDINSLIYPDKDKYLPHIDFEKLLSVNIRKNINKVADDFIYNSNSFYASLFNRQGKYTSGMSAKRIDILKHLESINKIDNPYCIADGQKLLRSEHLSNIIIQNRVLDLTHLSLLLKEIKNENKKGITYTDRTTNTTLIFLCFQTTHHHQKVKDSISKITRELYDNDNDFLQKLCFSFTLNKDKYNCIFKKDYNIDTNDEIYNMVMRKITSVQDNNLLTTVKNTILENFKGSVEQKSLFKSQIDSLIEKNTLNIILDVQSKNLPLKNKERRRI